MHVQTEAFARRREQNQMEFAIPKTNKSVPPYGNSNKKDDRHSEDRVM